MRPIPVAQTRPLRHQILRPHESIHYLVAHEPEDAFASGATRVWCNARMPARSLYERAGFKAISEEFDLPPIGPHLVMECLPRRDREAAAAAG